MYLQNLITELGIKSKFGKAILAAICYETLKTNKCGLTAANAEEVQKALIKNLCDRYMFEVLKLAASWCNDLVEILIRNEELKCAFDDIFKEHIWPYLRKNEVIPGVRMTD